MKYSVLALLILLLMPISTFAAEKGVKIDKITETIYMLMSPQGGNVIASIGEDGIFLIDDQLNGRSEIIDKALENLGGQDVNFILNTHYHFDHTGGNEFFGKHDGTVIAAHDTVRKRLSTKQFITQFKKEMKALSKEGLPALTFAQGMNFHYNGDEIKAIHIPAAHTDGDVIAHFTKANVIVTGDIVFNNMYPFLDIEHGGSSQGIMAAHQKIMALADENTIILPGHGARMNKADLKAYSAALATLIGRVEKLVKEEKTLEETQNANPTSGLEETLKAAVVGPKAFIKFVYMDLSR